MQDILSPKWYMFSNDTAGVFFHGKITFITYIYICKDFKHSLGKLQLSQVKSGISLGSVLGLTLSWLQLCYFVEKKILFQYCSANSHFYSPINQSDSHEPWTLNEWSDSHTYITQEQSSPFFSGKGLWNAPCLLQMETLLGKYTCLLKCKLN